MDSINDRAGKSLGWVRYVGWGSAAALLLLPLIGMRFTREVNWTAGDFLFAISMFATVGLALELVVRGTSSWQPRAGATLALATGFLLVWANGAVGYIGSEDNPYNLVFFGVIAVALLGSILARFRAAGLTWAMAAAGAAHAVAGGMGLPDDPRTLPITIGFVALWITSAAFFHHAARTSGAADPKSDAAS